MPSVADLQVLRLEELSELRDLYRTDWPKYAYTFYTLENFYCWRKHVRNGDVQVFTDSTRDWRKTGTFLIKDHNELFFDTLDETDDSMEKVLKTVMMSCNCNISLVYDSYFREMVNVLAGPLKFAKSSDEKMICYRQMVASADEPSNSDENLPEGYHFAPVSPGDRSFVEKHWEHNDPVFTHLPSRLIDRNPSLGVYDTTNQLVAWCLIDQTRSLAIFQTTAGHRRKGLGRSLIDRFSKQLHAQGQIPQAYVVENNFASRSLFEKLGFTAVDVWYWTKFHKQEM